MARSCPALPRTLRTGGALRLTASEVRRLSDAQSVLLSPLDYPARESWWLACLRAVKEAVGCDTANLVYASRHGAAGATEDFDPALFAVLGRVDDDDLDHMRAVRGTIADLQPVYVASETLRKYCRRRVADTRIFQEFMVPAGVQDGVGMVVPLPDGHTTLSVARSGRPPAGHAYPRERQLLALLVPSFAAGTHLLHAVQETRGAVIRLLEDAGLAFTVVAEDGRELHRNSRLRELLAAEPERERLLAAMRRLAGGRDRSLEAPPTVRLRTARADYEAVACHSARVLGSARYAVVCLRALGVPLPDAAALRRHWGLSAREAEIALLLAAGASNKAIAQRLNIRLSTVRTHAERIFVKLGVHSRKALALALAPATA